MATRTFIDGGKQAITFNNDTEPVAVYVDGEPQQNVSFVPQLAQGTGSAQYISEYKKNHIEYEIQGATSQATYEGYNLLNKEEFLFRALREETVYSNFGGVCLNTEQVQKMLKPNTQYTISYEVEGVEDLSNVESVQSGCGFALYDASSSTGRSARIYKYPKAIGEIIHASYTITTPTDLTGWKMHSYQYNLTIDGQTGFHSCILRNVQIVEGAEAKPYEPYVGGIPSPNPQYPQEIENANKEGMSVTLHGVNPFKFKDFTTSRTDSDGNVITLEMKDGIATINGISNAFITLSIPYTQLAVPSPTFKAGTYTYTPYYYREQGQRISGCDWTLLGYAYSSATGLATKTFENDFTFGSCRLYISPNTEYKDYKFAPAIFEGTYTSLDELPPYEPYFEPTKVEIPTSVEVDNGDGTTKTVDLPFTIYDKLIVNRVANTVTYAKKSGVKVFKGTEGFLASTSNDNSLYNYRIELYKIGFNETTSNGYCSHFTPVPRADYSEKYDVCFDVTDAFGDTSIYFLYDKLDNNFSTARDMFKSWVAEQYNAGTPLTIVAEYEEVEPIDITQSSLAQSLLNLATQNQTNYFEISSNEKAPQVPIKINYAKWGELVENNNNT